VREKNCAAGKKKYSDSETSSKESDSISDAGAATWVKEDITPSLGPFTGNPGVNKFYLIQQKCDE
jgi:hypothetical protein